MVRHAGYSYSGPAAAWAYKSLDVSQAYVITPSLRCHCERSSLPVLFSKRIFVLGPSHHVYLDSCALSRCDYYGTPLGDLNVDGDVAEELYATGQFTWMDQDTDEQEHSLEMHLPYIYKKLDLAGRLPHAKVVPIMVGAIRLAKEKDYGRILAPYLADPQSCFVISSDFCHW